MLRTLYKLTDENLTTQNNTKWVLGEWKETDGIQQSLCNSSWLHVYKDPYIAALIYPAHMTYDNPRCFRAEGDGKFLSDGTKCGVTKLRLVEEIPLPTITTEQRIKIAILCTMEIYKEEQFTRWANDWLSGKDRSVGTARSSIEYNNINTIGLYSCFTSTGIIENTIYADTAYTINRAVTYYNYFNHKMLDLIGIVQKVLKE
jgi:hypothetical protein